MNFLDIKKILNEEFSLREEQSDNLIKLLDDGNTVPFIARYRKEMHGSLDDQVIRLFSERLSYLRNLSDRKAEVQSSIESQEKWTEELAVALEQAKTLAEVEDLYRPYKPKRKTRGSVARAKGLIPLAEALLSQAKDLPSPLELSSLYINEELEVYSAEEALQGAMDIIAEDLSDSADLRKILRSLYWQKGLLISKANTEDDSVYRDYYEFSENVRTLPGHRILALDRGERENFLKIAIEIPEEEAISTIKKSIWKGESPASEVLLEVCQDSFTRLIAPSLERECRSTLTENAAEDAIGVFQLNLKGLLMQPPIKGHVVLALDPGFRTGCKLAVVDATGRVLDHGVIYNTPPNNKVAEAKKTVTNLITKHQVTVIAIGNGTASRESEQFIASLLSELQSDIAYIIVNEAGASVYSASKLASEEFPEYDVTIRGAISLARRLQDPMAELVKIDPKSIGVGQYQHDMPQKRLDGALSGVVEDCVNSVGVDLNTASVPLLSSVAGVNATVAKNIVKFREENGAFPDRKTLKKVAKLGAKTFEQCAGFLRVPESENILDRSAVHPESYPAATALLKKCGYDIKKVNIDDLQNLAEEVNQIGKKELAEELEIGLPTLLDIIKELMKPGRDPRDDMPKPLLRKDVLEMKDLTPDMILTGTVRNVTTFGAFVDIGVHEDGLVHISQLSDRFIKHPSEVVSVGDIVEVKVLSVEVDKKRIALTMKGLAQKTGQAV